MSTPAEQVASKNRRQQEQAAQAGEHRRQLAEALENVLGRADKRSADQQRVWDFLTFELRAYAGNIETNAQLIFEGQRRKALQIAELVDEAAKPIP